MPLSRNELEIYFAFLHKSDINRESLEGKEKTFCD